MLNGPTAVKVGTVAGAAIIAVGTGLAQAGAGVIQNVAQQIGHALGNAFHFAGPSHPSPSPVKREGKTIRRPYVERSWAVTGHIGGDLHFGLGPWNLDLNGGVAADITDHGAHAEFYNGYATGAGPKGIGGLGLGLGFSPLSGGLGLGSLQGFNGAGKSLSLESPWAAGSWDWNDSYHGFTVGANPLPLIWGFWYNKTQTYGNRFAGNDFDP